MNAAQFKELLSKQDFESLFVIDSSFLKSSYVKIDLSSDNSALDQLDLTNADQVEIYIQTYIRNHKAQIAYGGYLEKRNIYKRSAHFNSQIDPKDERNIHLGIDVWCPAETKVLSVFDGTIHSFQNNTNHGDYGPTIIIEHNTEYGKFYTLYGHLSLSSIQNKTIGQLIHKEETIGFIGDSSINGDYAPHLHFQIILDIENHQGDYPGVCSINQLDFYKINCPSLPIGNS